MKASGTIGLNEIMIVNPSTKEGAHTMVFYPMGQSPDELGYYGQTPVEEMGYYGQVPAEEMGYYGQVPAEEMGYYGQIPAEEMGYYGQVPADEMGYYGQAPDEAVGYYGQYPTEMNYYGQAPDAEAMGYYGQYPEPAVAGYVRDVEPAFNPRGVFNQLGGFVREKTVNPTCDLTKPAEVEMPPSYPAIFKPHF